MKKLILLLMILFLAIACKKNDTAGKVNYTILYTNSSTASINVNKGSNMLQTKGGEDSYYTQFGDYITSLSPGKFTAKFQMIRFHNDKALGVDGDVSGGGYQLELVNNNLPDDASERFADFSNNSSIDVTPSLGGDLDNERFFSADEIHFIYLFVLYQYLYQEVELPDQYDNINLFSDYDPSNPQSPQISNHILKVRDNFLTQGLYNLSGGGAPNLIIFGNTDSTYVSATEGNNPIWGDQGPAFRSNKFSTLIFYKPKSAESFHITTVMNFNSNNLIQVYAGVDNIPYTRDDVFVYAPKFWERFSVNVTTIDQ